MAYFEDFQPEAIRAKIVPKEGVYLCKVSEITQGNLEDGRRYVRVQCVVNSEGHPIVSLFLTEGESFNGNLTAFCDTFSIQRGNYDFDAWKDKRGYLKILLQKKGEYTNMVPRYILDENGYVVRPTPNLPQNTGYNQAPQQRHYGSMGPVQGDEEIEDIPF